MMNTQKTVLALALVAAFTQPAQATDRYWACGNSWWDITCWSSTLGGVATLGQPQNADNVFLTQSDATNRSVDYWNTAYPSAVLGNLTIDATGTGTMTLFQGTHALAATNEYIGLSGTGTFTQSGGTNAVVSDLPVAWNSGLYLGYNSGSNGIYNLSGTGNLSATNEYIGRSGTGTFNQSGGAHTVSYGLVLGIHSTGNGTYNLSAGSLSAAAEEIIGHEGTGTFAHSGGTHTVSTLYLGNYSSSNGIYNLSGTGNLSATNEYIGLYSAGTFNQSGGTHTVYNGLALGYYSGGNGSYNLSGTGSLTAGNEIIGSSGTGTFTQSGGTHTVSNSLTLGNNSSGSYNLSGTGSLTAGNEIIGSSGTGTFTQSGGTHTVSNTLSLGTNSTGNGTYSLIGGTLNVGGNVVNGAGTGTLNLDGGTLIAGSGGSGGIDVDNLVLGGTVGSNGSYIVSAEGLYRGAQKMADGITVGNLTLGGSGTGTLTLSSGALTVSNNLALGANSGSTGTFILSDGSLNVGGNIINGAGSGSLIINGGALTVGSVGSGSIDVDNLVLGQVSGANVSYTLSAAGLYQGSQKVASALTISNLTLGESGIGNFTQTSGTNTVESLTINKESTYKLSGGALTVNSSLSNNGTLAMAGSTVSGGGTLTQSATGTLSGYGIVSTNINNAGTINAKSGNLILNGSNFTNTGLVKNSAGSNLFIESTKVKHQGNIEVNSAGAVVFDAAISNVAGKNVTLLGGTLATPTLTNEADGNVKGFGTLTGNLTNAGAVEFYGPTNIVGAVANQKGGTMLVRNDQTLITGHTVNDGTIQTLKGTVVFEGGLTNNGAYLSDPSNNYFTDLIVSQTGYLVGEIGDNFIISGSFANNSLQNALWNTGAASLFLNGSGKQDLYLAGADLGALMSGYGNNFAWGEFSLGSGVSAKIWDSNGDPGAALYVGLFELGGGLSQLSSIYSDYNIYYDPTLAGNAYLGGQTLALNGAGFLTPVSAVPVPAAVWLFGSGLLGLIGVARRKSRGITTN